MKEMRERAVKLLFWFLDHLPPLKCKGQKGEIEFLVLYSVLYRLELGSAGF
jgi:hypothetical protein